MPITTRILNGFEDDSFGEKEWTLLLSKSQIETVNMTWLWQRNWWKHFGKGRLLLILAEEDNKPIALAPFFTASGMIYNICPEDALDFIGDVSAPYVLDSLLQTACAEVDSFSGFRFYFIPQQSQTAEYLNDAASRLGFKIYQEHEIPSPFLAISLNPENALAVTRKKSLVRHENYFKRGGKLEVFHYSDQWKIENQLPAFFEQHIQRRDITNAKSIFNDPLQQQYYYNITSELGKTGWLRFTCVSWNGSPIAYHYGLSYKGRYLYGIPSFDINLMQHSPGEVLLRQVILAAINEGAEIFDFGIGDESYKYRFSNGVNNLITWGIYPSIN